MKNWSLNLKLTFVMSIFGIGAVFVAGLGIVKLNEINDSLKYLVGTVAERARIATRLDAGTSSLMNREKTLILEEEPEAMKAASAKIDAGITKLASDLDAFEAVASERGMRRLGELRAVFDKWTTLNKAIRNLAMNGRRDEAFTLARTEGRRQIDSFDEILADIRKSSDAELEEEVAAAEAVYTMAKNLMILASSLTILLASILAFVVLRVINKTIDRIIDELTENSSQVSSASRQIAASSEDLSQAATEQASSLEETSASIEEISSMVKRNSENAKNSADSSDEGQKAARRGKEVINKMKDSMKDINQANTNVMDQVNESNQRISELAKVIKEIGEKTEVINDIVFQTKLLSFNASVEAARAGEHGKGFAVVAEEVGNLAQMSGKAATEISEMLEASIQRVESTISESKSTVEALIAEGRNKVEVGSSIAEECGLVLEEILEKSSEINEMVKSIAIASSEQTEGIEQITLAMSQMDQVTQTNAATSEEAASAAEELSQQAEGLKAVVDDLVTSIKGAGASRASIGSNKESKPVATSAANVIQLKTKLDQGKSNPSGKNSAAPDKFLGQSGIPSENDARFKEV